MSGDTTAPNNALSPAYRHAQRVMAGWLEDEQADARRARFVLRAAWSALDAAERDRMTRWLAWLSVAAESHDDIQLTTRIQRLDAALAQTVTHAMRTLPVQRHATRAKRLRLSA